MWRSQIESLSGYTSAVRFDSGGHQPSFHEVLGLWQRDIAFRSFFLELLSMLPFTALRFELPPLTKASAGGPFECVIVDSPERAKVGEAIEARLGPKAVWPNTAGAGVPWLHVRLDDRPKYYRHRPYRMGPAP